MQIIAMTEKSSGNETVGEMWTETKIFEDSDTLKDVYKWANDITFNCDNVKNVRANIKLSIAQ